MSDGNWVKVADHGDIDDEDAICVLVDGCKIAVFYVSGEYFATDDLCTHEEASLSEGYIDGPTVECPLHQAVFCLKTGKPLEAPAEKPVRTLQVKVEDGSVFVKSSELEAS